MDKISANKTEIWKKYYRLNNYYHLEYQHSIRNIIPIDASVLEFSCRGGELLKSLPNKSKVGVEFDDGLVKYANKKLSKVPILLFNKPLKLPAIKRFDYIIFSHTSSDIDDLQGLIKQIKRFCDEDTRVVVSYFNFFWRPLHSLIEKVGLKHPSFKEPNWLTEGDVDNFFYLEDFEKIKSIKKVLIPYKIPLISDLVNRYIAPFPLINYLCFNNYSIYRLKPKIKDYSVSVVIPARNEAGNMPGVIKKIPNMSRFTEVIFVEGHSKDKTYEAIQEEIEKYNGPYKIFLFKQKGKGKGDAVRLGFSKAKNELLMILDADLTVEPKELPKFYDAVAQGKGNLVMGSRLVYPMEDQAMRDLNYLGNKFFSWAFSYLLGQKIKDTLCGTKVITKTHYKKIEKNRKVFGDFDPFGDYDLIFGAARLNLKITEVPIRYKERTYGTTNISRFKHGLLLFKMLFFAARKIKFV